MTKKETSQLDNLTARVDLLFSILSNNLQATQMLQVNSAANYQLEKDPSNKDVKSALDESLKAYQFHSENINRGIDFYAKAFGDDAQKRHEQISKSIIPEASNNDSNEDSKLQEAAKMAEDALKEMKEENEKEGNA